MGRGLQMVCKSQPAEVSLVQRANHTRYMYSLFASGCNNTEDTEIEGVNESELEAREINK